MLPTLSFLQNISASLDLKFEPTLNDDQIAFTKLENGELTIDDPSVKQAVLNNPQLILNSNIHLKGEKAND